MEKYSITRCSKGSSKSRLAVNGGDRGCRADIGAQSRTVHCTGVSLGRIAGLWLQCGCGMVGV